MNLKGLSRFGPTYSFRSLLLYIDWWTKAFPCFDADYMRARGGGGWRREAANVSKSLFFIFGTVESMSTRAFLKGTAVHLYCRAVQTPRARPPQGRYMLDSGAT